MGECRYFPYFIVCYFGKEREGDDTHEGAVSIGSFIGEAFSAAEGGSRGHAYIEGFSVRGILAVFIPVGHAAHEVFQVDPPHEFDAVASGKGEAGVIGPCSRFHVVRAVTCHFFHME